MLACPQGEETERDVIRIRNRSPPSPSPSPPPPHGLNSSLAWPFSFFSRREVSFMLDLTFSFFRLYLSVLQSSSTCPSSSFEHTISTSSPYLSVLQCSSACPSPSYQNILCPSSPYLSVLQCSSTCSPSLQNIPCSLSLPVFSALFFLSKLSKEAQEYLGTVNLVMLVARGGGGDRDGGRIPVLITNDGQNRRVSAYKLQNIMTDTPRFCNRPLLLQLLNSPACMTSEANIANFKRQQANKKRISAEFKRELKTCTL